MRHSPALGEVQLVRWFPGEQQQVEVKTTQRPCLLALRHKCLRWDVAVWCIPVQVVAEHRLHALTLFECN
jgi:hypothetical protein